MRRKTKRGKSIRAGTNLGLTDLEHAKSAVLVGLRSPKHNGAIGVPSTISSAGIALSPGSPSTRQSLRVTGFISKIGC
jgi:hypothetical protein